MSHVRRLGAQIEAPSPPISSGNADKMEEIGRFYGNCRRAVKQKVVAYWTGGECGKFPPFLLFFDEDHRVVKDATFAQLTHECDIRLLPA